MGQLQIVALFAIPFEKSLDPSYVQSLFHLMFEAAAWR